MYMSTPKQCYQNDKIKSHISEGVTSEEARRNTKFICRRKQTFHETHSLPIENLTTVTSVQ